MAKNYPHIADTTYPNVDSVNVYKYQNNFDYSRWQADVSCKLCNVSWDSDYNNTVKFDDDTKRDAYFDKLAGQKVDLTIANHKLVNDSLKVPLPFDVCNYYNYVVLDYPTPTSETKPLMYELPPRRSKYFYFIKDYRSLAGNTTELFLQLDTWTTYINSIDIRYMMLERGHYPLAKTNVDTYLSNPIENNELLLEPDINKSEAENIQSEEHIVFNDEDTMCVIACACDPTQNDWGDYVYQEVYIPTTNIHIPSIAGVGISGENYPNVTTFAVETSYLQNLLNYINWNIPQFYRTIKAVFFLSKKYINLGKSFTFAGGRTNYKCWYCQGKQGIQQLIKLNKAQFNYDDKYKELAKLYTSPYAYIEINNEQGETILINIENTAGKIDVNYMISFAISNLYIETDLIGINGNGYNSITFKNVSNNNFNYGGSWYKTFLKWDIPTFAVYETPICDNAVTSFYTRKQAGVAMDNLYDNQVAMAQTTQSNANASASTAQSNANASAKAELDNAKLNANNQIENNVLQVSANNNSTNQSNNTMWTDTDYGNKLNESLQAYSAGYNRATQQAEATAEAISAGIGLANNLISGVLSGNPIGLAQNVASGLCNAANTANTVNLEKSKVELTITQSANEVQEKNRNASDKCTLQQTNQTALTNIGNDNSTAQTANNAQTLINTGTNTYNANVANASRQYNTDTGNASRQYNTDIANAERDKNTAYRQVQNDMYGAHLEASHAHGKDNAITASSKPIGIWANVVTQPKGAIASVGDEFLRYGYMLNQQVKVDKLNLMKHFTYWLASDIINTLEDVSINKNEQQSIIDIFKQGVTVWSNPEDIGAVSIYDNN